jgi:hypothetical protein
MTCSEAKCNAKFIPVKFTKQAEGADTHLNPFLTAVYFSPWQLYALRDG